MDELGQWTVQISAQGDGGPWTTIAQPVAGDRSFTDAPRATRCWYRITQTTAEGVSIPFNIAYLTTNPQGLLSVTYDGLDLVFQWSDPGPGDAVSGFVFDAREMNTADTPDNWESVDLYDADVRTATIAAQPGFIYRLKGIGI